VDVYSEKVTGQQAERALEKAGITVNKNVIPFDTNPPVVASGIRVGTPAVTTRGLREPQMELIAQWISEVLHNVEDESVQKRIRSQVEALTEKFPLYETRRAVAASL
jgi:glycine hydroxymethyltransferase